MDGKSNKKRGGSSNSTHATADPKRQNTNQALQYHLVLNDGTVTFEENIAQLSPVLTSAEPGEILLPQFSVSTAKALLQVIHHQTSRNLSPTDFAHVLQFSDFLCIDTVCKTMLRELEVLTALDPLARLRNSCALLPSLSTMLQRWLEIDSTSNQEIQELLHKLVSNDPSTVSSCLTYRELDLCDGQHFGDVLWGHLCLSSFGAHERARRTTLIANHIARTKELRAHLPTDSSSEEGKALDVEFTAAMFVGCQTKVNQMLQMSKFVLSQRVLDLSMWRAVKEGRVDVAEQLFRLGATPTLTSHIVLDVMSQSQTKAYMDPTMDPTRNSFQYPRDGDKGSLESMTEFKTTLMLATYNNDLPMMDWLLTHGCDVNLVQQSFVYDDEYSIGGMSALSFVGSEAAMKMLLSHGANPNNSYVAWSNYEGQLPNISVLLHLVSDDTLGKACFREVNWNEPYNSPLRLSLARLLVKSGADVNEAVIDSVDQGGEGELLAYWPNVVISCAQEALGNSYSSLLPWCEQMLVRHGADSNWPLNSVCETHFRSGRSHGNTVLLMAVLRNNIPLVKLLLRHGANPNQYEIPHFGEEEGNGTENIKSLERCFDFDGNIFDKDKYQSPLSAAKRQNNNNMAQLLESHGANKLLEVDMEGYKLIHPCPFEGRTWDEILFENQPDYSLDQPTW